MLKKVDIVGIIKKNINQFMLIIEMIAIFLLFSVLTDGMFLTPINVSNLLMQACTFSLLAIGMVFLLIAGEIDISAGAALGFLGTLAAILQCKLHMGTISVIIITVIFGLVIGAWNGFWVAYCNIPSFIVTMASQLVFKGLTLLIGGGTSIGPMSDKFCVLGQGYIPSLLSDNINVLTLILVAVFVIIYIILELKKRKDRMAYNLEVAPLWRDYLKIAVICLVMITIAYVLAIYKGIPYAVLLLLAITIIFSVVANSTAFGRRTYAIGGNKEVAKLSGINVRRSTFMLFVQMGMITAIASIQYLGRIRQATPQAGTSFEFSAITGCIVGGASTMGGVGTVIGAVIGTVLVAGIDNGMSLLNLSAEWQNIVKGLILLFAVAIDIITKKKK
ncbi:D-xylose transport system permease protein [Lachnospiraceae bacterium PF1-22]|uniref:sugar ABC transporter permease n=1 Tax=Ohessyouella blattaphilus TaxID=2949333 RepID=UPI003E18183F